MKTPSPAKTRKPKAAATPVAPDPAPAIDEPLTFDDDGIKRVQDIIRNARATWFALLGALVFASVTLAGVKDISFFVNTIETKLPIVGISVPVVSFFWAGSLLIAALYAYFHLYLELLWQALGDFPARDKSGALLADRIEPWIVADTALRFRDWLRGDTGEKSASRKRAMPWISGFVSLGLVWVFGLAVIFWFWWRSMPAHEPLLTLFLGMVLWVTVFVFGTSLAGAWTHLKFENHEAQRPVYWQWSVPLVFVAIVGATLVRTGKEPILDGPEAAPNPLLFGETVCGWQKAKSEQAVAAPEAKSESQAASDPTETVLTTAAPKPLCWRRSDLFARILSPAPANLREAVFTEKPRDWQGKEIAETEFRIRWCKERGEPKCGNPLNPAKRKFEGVAEKEFQAAWKERWEALLATFPKPDLQDADLRGAMLDSTELEGANLLGANFGRASLINASLDGANLNSTRFKDATLMGADLSGAKLSYANFERADLSYATFNDAEMDSAVLSDADLTFAVMKDAKLERAIFDRTKLEHTSLHNAALVKTRFTDADLDNARLNGVDLHRSRLFGLPSRVMVMEVILLVDADFDLTALRNVKIGNFAYFDNSNKSKNINRSFGDASVVLPQDVPWPCHWGRKEEGQLDDAQFFGRWRGWIESLQISTSSEDFDNYPSIPPPPGCVPPPTAP